MQSLRNIINKYMFQVTCFFLFFTLFLVGFFQLIGEQQHAYINALQTFSSIEQILAENQEDMAKQLVSLPGSLTA